MRTVKLYGHLGKQFGKLHAYEIRTPAEAIKALRANYPGFDKALLDDNYIGYKVLVGKDNRSETEKLMYPADGEIKIIPIIKGAGGNGSNWGMIALGVVLVAVAIAAPYLAAAYAPAVAGAGAGTAGAAAGGAAGAAGAAAGTAATVANVVNAVGMAVGMSLMMSGIAGLLFSPSAPTAMDAEEQITSTYFNGSVNLTTQGNPVPLIYGKLRVGSQVVSAGLLTYKV